MTVAMNIDEPQPLRSSARSRALCGSSRLLLSVEELRPMVYHASYKSGKRVADR